MSAICEEGFGTTRLDIPETVSRTAGTADRPETTAAFPASHEVVTGSNPNLTQNPPHIILDHAVFSDFAAPSARFLLRPIGEIF